MNTLVFSYHTHSEDRATHTHTHTALKLVNCHHLLPVICRSHVCSSCRGNSEKLKSLETQDENRQGEKSWTAAFGSNIWKDIKVRTQRFFFYLMSLKITLQMQTLIHGHHAGAFLTCGNVLQLLLHSPVRTGLCCGTDRYMWWWCTR